MFGRKNRYNSLVILIVGALITLLCFLWALDLMILSFQSMGGDAVMKIIQFTSNPFISLFVGLLITAVIQSSSTSTSLVVAIVASGNLSLENAVPMVMGANVGTTLTSTIVSLGYITNNREFKNALMCGVMHDFFNIMTVSILFPLQYFYGFLSSLAKGFSQFFVQPVQTETNAPGLSLNFISELNQYLTSLVEYKIFLTLLSAAFLFASIKVLSRIISKKLIGTAQEKFQDVFFRNTFKSFSLGVVFTSLIQSSSIATTIIVPFGVAEKIPIKKIFPYIVGSNIGTTLTAIIASFAKSEEAVSIAITHFLFNAIGALIFLVIPFVKDLPLRYSEKFTTMVVQYKIVGLGYILVVFFLFPLALIFLSRL